MYSVRLAVSASILRMVDAMEWGVLGSIFCIGVSTICGFYCILVDSTALMLWSRCMIVIVIVMMMLIAVVGILKAMVTRMGRLTRRVTVPR